MASSSKFGIKKYLTSSGVFAPEIDIFDDTKIRLITVGASPSNEITLYGRIAGQNTWTIVDSITGSSIKDFDMSLLDAVDPESFEFPAKP